MRAAIYTRVSTRGTSKYGDKTAFDQNPEVQEAPLRSFIGSRGWTVAKSTAIAIAAANPTARRSSSLWMRTPAGN